MYEKKRNDKKETTNFLFRFMKCIRKRMKIEIGKIF